MSSKQKKITPMEMEYYKGKSNEEINKLISQFINELKFEEAKVAKQALATKKETDSTNLIEKIKSDIEKAAKQAKEQWDQAIIQIDEKYEQDELNIRQKIATTFHVLQDQHKEQLMEIEKKFAIEILKSIERPVPAQIALQTQAKKVAREGELDGAIKLREESDQSKEKELQNRRSQIEELFKGQKEKAAEKQKKELTVLTEKLEKSLVDLQKERDQQYVEKERVFAVTCHSAEQKQILYLSDKTKKNENKPPNPEDVKSIHVFLREIVKELTGRDDILTEFSKDENEDKKKKLQTMKQAEKTQKQKTAPQKTATQKTPVN